MKRKHVSIQQLTGVAIFEMATAGKGDSPMDKYKDSSPRHPLGSQLPSLYSPPFLETKILVFLLFCLL